MMGVEIDFDGTWRKVVDSDTYNHDGKKPYSFNPRTYDDKQITTDARPLLQQNGELEKPEALPATLDIDV